VVIRVNSCRAPAGGDGLLRLVPLRLVVPAAASLRARCYRCAHQNCNAYGRDRSEPAHGSPRFQDSWRQFLDHGFGWGDCGFRI